MTVTALSVDAAGGLIKADTKLKTSGLIFVAPGLHVLVKAHFARLMVEFSVKELR
jgi:hypothetical protein